MIVLSLFDGMACGRIALDRAGIPVEKYYAFEIDKPAIKVAQKNWPDIIHLGDVNNWRYHKIEQPDLIIAGSPCQGFSLAGKQLNFEDPRSKLFFVFVEVLKYFNPKYFLLENVMMRKEYQQTITSLLGVEPVKWNSALVSAQNRNRLYWFNWDLDAPKDRGLALRDAWVGGIDITERYLSKKHGTEAYRKSRKQTCSLENKSFVVLTDGVHRISKSGSTNVRIGNRYFAPDTVTVERLQTVPDNYTEGVSKTQRYKMLGNGWTVDMITHILSGIR